MSRSTRGAVTERKKITEFYHDGAAVPNLKFFRQYPKWWMDARRHHQRPPTRLWRAIQWRRLRRAERDQIARVEPDAYTPVNPRPRAGDTYCWY